MTAPPSAASVAPPHPTVDNHPAPLVSRYLVAGEDLWSAGPWKTLVKTAEASGWLVRGYVARGYQQNPVRPSDGLADSVSLRCWRDRNEVGDVDRAVAVWSRRTWPTLGKAKRGEDDEPAGEGRKTTEGKTWLWHPPMAPPDIEVDTKGKPKDPLVIAWKFDAAWIWTAGAPVNLASSTELRNWLKRVPG